MGVRRPGVVSSFSARPGRGRPLQLREGAARPRRPAQRMTNVGPLPLVGCRVGPDSPSAAVPPERSGGRKVYVWDGLGLGKGLSASCPLPAPQRT